MLTQKEVALRERLLDVVTYPKKYCKHGIFLDCKSCENCMFEGKCDYLDVYEMLKLLNEKKVGE